MRATFAGHPTSLRRHPPFTPRAIAVWLALALAGIGVALLGVLVEAGWIVLLAWVVAATAGPLGFCADFGARTGLLRRPPWLAAAVGVFLGGPTAVLVAGAASAHFPAIGSNAHTLLIGPIEEAAKLLVPVLLLGTHRVDQRAALICAIATAASFQAIENLLVAAGTINLGGEVRDSMLVLGARGIVGPFTHCMWTATIAIAWFGTRDRPVLSDPRTRRLVGWFCLVAALHSLWDVATGMRSPVGAPVLAIATLAGTLLAHGIATRPSSMRWARARRAGVGRKELGS